MINEKARIKNESNHTLGAMGFVNSGGRKLIETRSWNTNYRGRIAIHAAKKIIRDIRAEVRVIMEENMLSFDDLEFGNVVATAEIVDCVLMTQEMVDGLSPQEYYLGDWQVGRYAWILKDVKQLDEPVAVKGFQGIWNLDDEFIPEEYR